MISATKQLLEMLTTRFKPLRSHEHQVVLHNNKLQINLVHVAPCWKITLNEEDLQKTPEDLLIEIVKLIPRA